MTPPQSPRYLGAVLLLVACSHPGAEFPDADAAQSMPDASESSVVDGGTFTTLPLGTLTVVSPSVPCPGGAAPGATCMTATVSCAGEPDLDLTIADVEPTGTAVGTVVAHDGGAGTGFYNGNTTVAGGFSKALTAKHYRFVQLAWAGDWASTGMGIKKAGCRPATAFRWVFDHLHGGSQTAGFCGTGSSGGTAALLYSVAAYGLKDIWDHLQLAAGPTPARIDYGCDPTSYAGGARDLCPLLPNARWKYNYVATGSSSVVPIVDGWEGTTTCDSASPPASNVSTWASDSLVSPSDDLSYAQTTMSFWYCVSTPNMSTGQGSFYIEQAHPKNEPVAANCYSGVCQGEEVFEDTTAFAAAIDDMTTHCVPNH